MPRTVRLISWPYHCGLRDVGMGAGATRLASDERLHSEFEQQGWHLSTDEVAAVDESGPEIARVIELVRRLSSCVADAVAEGAFPLVLAGNCNSCLGTLAAVGVNDLGAVWFDAHPDFDDPEENLSGYFDVMALAMLTGRGWAALRATIPNHQPLPESHVVLAGVRDLEPYQRRRLDASSIHAVPGAIDQQSFADAIAQLAPAVSRIYLHIDLDSLDTSVASANRYAAPGGPSLDRVAECIRLCCERFDVAAAAITAYDPSFDGDDRALAAARRIAREIARGVGT